MIIKGKAVKYEDNINTDEIIPAKYLNIADSAILGKHCLEGLDSEFTNKVKQGKNIIVAGENFGCGSSREHAAVAIKSSGVLCVVACSFARIFFRNAISIGLPIVELEQANKKICSADELKIDLVKGEIENTTKKEKYMIVPFPEFMQNIINAGGLVPYIKKFKRKQR